MAATDRQPVKQSKKDMKAKKQAAANGDLPASNSTGLTEVADKQLRKEVKRQKKLALLLAGSVAADAVPAAEVGPAAANAAAPVPEDAEQLRRDRKAAKKERKRLKLLAAAGGAAADAGQPPSAASAKQQKKAKKRKAQAEEANINGAAAPAALGAAQPKAKKQKLSSNGASAAVAGPKTPHSAQSIVGGRMAAVGDAELAKRSKPLRKQLYSEHPDVTATSDAEVAAWQAERQIVVTGSNLKPVFEFTQAGFPAELLHATRDFVQPSPIQSQCWPIVQTGHDLVGIAATGSGKTLAFGLPALRHILAQKEAGVGVGQKGPRVLILSPTRELAQQISAVMEEAGSKCGGRCLCAYGGVPKQPQVKALRAGVEVVVATPGRLEDLCNDGSCRLEGVSYLVLDEADRMLDLGFEPHIRAIAMQTRADRQTLMFSATWPHEIQKLAAEFMLDPVKVTIGSQDLSASHSVTQVVEVIDPQKRDARIIELLQQYHSSRKNRIILFVLYKKEATRVESMLTRKGWKAVAVHGDISQQQRTRAVEQFKAGTVPLLIATDVAARGLDIPDVEAVLNYSFPLTTEDYVHRIGRTGRAGKTGVAHTFFSGQTDKARAGELINVLREAGQAVPEELLKFGTTVKRKESKLYGAFGPSGTVDMTKKAVKITFDDSDAE